MSQPAGRKLALSLPRRFICDLVHFAHQVPSVPVQRRMNVAAVAAARERATPRPSWCALFTKAYACVAAAMPELRRAYMAFPRAHLYEHPLSIASVALERHYGEEEAVFFAPIRTPDTRPLAELDAELRRYKEQPIESLPSFRRALLISRFPRLLRRFVWWFGLNVWGRKRAAYMGTFGVSVYAGLGAASLHPLSPLTTALNYGVIEPNGDIDVRIIYDHRVMDGATIARALARMEDVLSGHILNELHALRAAEAA